MRSNAIIFRMYFYYFVNAAPSKIYSEKKITAFFSDFAQFKLKRALFLEFRFFICVQNGY